MNEKISPERLQRAAYVYVRQSTTYQVRHHREGQQRQYDLRDRARQLGFGQVVGKVSGMTIDLLLVVETVRPRRARCE